MVAHRFKFAMYSSMIRKLCLLMLTAVAMMTFSSCADTDPKPDSSNNTGVSSIPWDRPEKWENGSNLPGGFEGSR